MTRYARHTFSNAQTPPVTEWVSLPEHKPLNNAKSIALTMKSDPNVQVEYVQVVTEDRIQLDAWINKPANFDPKQKVPCCFYVYGFGGHYNG